MSVFHVSSTRVARLHITVIYGPFCGPCERVVVVSNNRIVLSNHTKLLAGAVRARVYLKKQ